MIRAPLRGPRGAATRRYSLATSATDPETAMTHQPPLPPHHRGRRARAEPLDVLRPRLRGRRLQEADDRRRQRPLDDHAVQLRPAEARRRGRRRHRGSRRQRADLRHADDQRRHGDGHRGHEVQPGLARGDRRLHRDLRRRPVDGRRARRRRLRQEHARRHDGHPARQRAGDLRLRRHHPARPLPGPGPQHRQRVRGGRPVHRRQR